MIKNQTFDKLGVRGELMDHMHDFNHVQIDGFVWYLNDVDSIDNYIYKLVGQIWVKLTAKWSSGNTDQKWFLYGLLLNFKLVQKLKCLLSCQFIPLSDNSGMDLLNHKMQKLLIG